jgi:hypothetical protein
MDFAPRRFLAPERLMLVAGLHLGLGIVLWCLSGGWSEAFGLYFRYLGSSFLVIFAFLELVLSRSVRSAFQPGEDLYRAWTLITIGAGLRLTGVFVAHGLQPEPRIRDIALFISGPLQLVTLVWGLTIVLRLYRRLGYVVRITRTDWALLIGCVAMAANGIVQNVITPSSGFLTDTLLFVLLFQAILLRRSASQMGGGLVAACWTAYVYAIFLTAVGDLGITLSAYGYVPQAWMPATWLVWYPAAAAFALGPAYLSEAVFLAMQSEAQRYPAACKSKSSA